MPFPSIFPSVEKQFPLFSSLILPSPLSPCFYFLFIILCALGPRMAVRGVAIYNIVYEMLER